MFVFSNVQKDIVIVLSYMRPEFISPVVEEPITQALGSFVFKISNTFCILSVFKSPQNS